MNKQGNIYTALRRAPHDFRHGSRGTHAEHGSGRVYNGISVVNAAARRVALGYEADGQALPARPAGGVASRDASGRTVSSVPVWGHTETSRHVWVVPKQSRISRYISVAASILFAVIIGGAANLAHSALPPGTVISNTAEASYAVGGIGNVTPSNTVNLTTVPERTPAEVEFLRYAPGPGIPNVEQVIIKESWYKNASGRFSPMLPPVKINGAAIDISSPVPLVAASVFASGETIFLRLTDLDQNRDPYLAEWVNVRVKCLTPGEEEEIVRLFETGPDTGVFTGYIRTTKAPSALNDGILTLEVGCEIRGDYTDRFDWTDKDDALALIDPFGKVFNSLTGAPVDGAIVTLVDVGKPGGFAIVYGDDGVSIYNGCNGEAACAVTTGGSAVDSGGNTYSFIPGGYRFPLLEPGTYRLDVIAPAGYAAPSTVATSALQSLPGAPFAILEPGSRGEAFVINPGPAIHIDIPIDPFTLSLFVWKRPSKDNVSIGDFLQYEVGLQNTSSVSIAGITVLDTLPPGFRYRKGSAKIDGVKAADPAISSDGRTLSFGPMTLAASVTTSVKYVVEVSAGARAGTAVNTAFATSGGINSNSARATVKVKEEFFRDKAIILGRVSDALCGEDTIAAMGVKGIRIYLEDGTYVITDSNGMYHFEGVKPGAHVVQLDKLTAPEGYEVAQCADNTRFAGNDFSQFVELEGGSMWRADFRLIKLPDPPPPPPPAGEVSIALRSVFTGDTIEYSVPVTVRDVPMISLLNGDIVEYSVPITVRDVPLVNARLMVMLPSGAYYLPGTSVFDGAEIADPEETGGALVYRLGDIPAGWEGDARFNAAVVPVEENGDMKTVAVFLFDTAAEKGKRTPPVDNVISRAVAEEKNGSPGIVIRPYFPVMSAELGDKAVKTLKPVAEELRALNIMRIFVTGHTDSTPINPVNRKIFDDNYALSKARAASVARYFMDSLGLNPSQVIIDGKGADEPVASNKDESGRTLNRRVEVSVESETVKNTVNFEPVKTESAKEIVETKGVRVTKAEPSGKGNSSPKIGYADFSVDKEAPGFEILWPAEGHYPPIPSVNIAIKHGGKERVSIFLNKEPVSPLNFEDTVKNNDATVAITRWRGVDLKDGDNTLEAILFDGAGSEIGRVSAVTHYSGEPVTAALVKDKSVLVADAKTPIVMAVRLTDRDGKPAREGAIGEFLVVPPHMAKSKADAIDKAALTAIGKDSAQFTVGEDGVALIELKPTAQSGEAVVKLRLASGEREVRAWVAPEDREWILVGFAEGTAGYNTVSGNIENMQAPDGDEHFYDDGRVAFFAKGKIAGSWLMTAAYDSGKDAYNEGSLNQTIDPGSYYTVYGDSTEQGYAAASSRKLYVKMEREAFYVLFGDYDTGLTVTELGRYNRSFNGLKSEYRSERFGYTAFIADTNKAFQKDEILGDGTSGLYRLSRKNIVENSEKVVIEIRDRWRSEVVISSRPLARHIDYDIDYGASTIFFKEPIPSKDEFFNPIYIVADYESMDPVDKEYNYGGRAYVKTSDNAIEAGATHVHEGRIGAEGNLYGVDASVKVSDAVKVKVEAASTENQSGGLDKSGTAYVLEAAHDGAKLNAKAYVREQDSEFGLGQQKGSESGTRKIGAEGAYRAGDKISYNGQIYRQSNLSTDADRDLVEARINYREKRYSLFTGIRRVDDRLGDGTVNDSTQLTLGGALRVLDDRLSLSISRDQSIFSGNNSVDFPTRTVLGADYKIAEKASLFISQEFTDGNDESSEATRLGVKASLWKGFDVNSSLGRSYNENGERIFSNTGVKQSLSLTEKWTLDAGLDNSSTLKHPGNIPFNVNVPPASGGTEDFTAVSLGAGYRETTWGWTSRVETRNAETYDKWSFLTGVYGEPDKGLGVSLGLRLSETDNRAGGDGRSGDIRLGVARRPNGAKWIALNKTDIKFDELDASGVALGYDSRRIVNNLNVNIKADSRNELSLQYGAKYVKDTIDGDDYSGYTDLMGIGLRHDVTGKWDVGARASVLHSWNMDEFDYGAGVSVGHNFVKNVWLSVGYNFIGFTDRDFSGADFTEQGPYLRFRMKFDQESLKDMAKWLGGL